MGRGKCRTIKRWHVQYCNIASPALNAYITSISHCLSVPWRTRITGWPSCKILHIIMFWVLIFWSNQLCPHQFPKVVDVLAQKSSQPQTEGPFCLLIPYTVMLTSTVFKSQIKSVRMQHKVKAPQLMPRWRLHPSLHEASYWLARSILKMRMRCNRVGNDRSTLMLLKRMSKVQSPSKLMAAETVQLCNSFLTLSATNSYGSSAEITT